VRLAGPCMHRHGRGGCKPPPRWARRPPSLRRAGMPTPLDAEIPEGDGGGS
jgi:hypothetical protein